MHAAAFLQDLAVVMTVAGLVTIAFRLFRQPVVLGYILAGLLIGPHLLPWPLISEEESIHTLAELGVVFLLFALGLEFNLRKIRQLGATAFLVAPLETGVMFFAGYQLGQVFGWSGTDSSYLGALMSISSTTIIARTLAEQNRSRERFAEVIFGILIAEDVVAIVIIATLSGVGLSGSFAAGEILATIGRLSIFLVMLIVLGLLLVPRLFGFVARFKSDEMLLITALALCFGISLLALKLGYSVALGAFIMGALIAEAREARKIEALIGPLRGMFSAVFFVAIGLLIDPKLLVDYAVPVLIISAVVVLGKIVACSFGSFVAGYDRGIALRVGLGLAQIGEFSFIIASLGTSLGVTSDFLYPIAVSVSATTALLSPYFIRHADKLVALHDRWAPPAMINYQQLYTSWVSQLRAHRKQSPARQAVRQMARQLAIIAALIAGLFLSARFLYQHLPFGWLRVPAWMGGEKSVAWLAAMLISLPLVIAFYRKLEALGMFISEMAMASSHRHFSRVTIRVIVANTVLFAGIIILALLILLLSSGLLPAWEILVILLLIAALAAVLLWRFFIRVYARAQFSIRETLEREPLPEEELPAKPLPPLFAEAELQTLNITPELVAAGKQIQELELRSKTGATVVAIKRGTTTLINPSPDEEFQPGDQVLLLGNATQLAAGLAYLRRSQPFPQNDSV